MTAFNFILTALNVILFVVLFGFNLFIEARPYLLIIWVALTSLLYSLIGKIITTKAPAVLKGLFTLLLTQVSAFLISMLFYIILSGAIKNKDYESIFFAKYFLITIIVVSLVFYFIGILVAKIKK